MMNLGKNLNNEFKQGVVSFLQTHDLMVSPQGHGSTAISPGLTRIDLVMSDASITPQAVRLESYDNRSHNVFSESAIDAFFLDAALDGASTLRLDNRASYMFTADLSGCLFAAYGDNNSNLTVEHVNARTSAAAGLITTRASEICSGNYPYLFMISPQPLNSVGNATVVTYTTGCVVVGLRNVGGSWNFAYRHDGQRATQV